MNELESYYNQSSNMGQTLGMIQRGEVAQRQGALAVQEAKDDISGALQTEKEKTEDEGGGVGLGVGMLSKEGLAVVGKRIIKTATEKARTAIQGKVDDFVANKAASIPTTSLPAAGGGGGGGAASSAAARTPAAGSATDPLAPLTDTTRYSQSTTSNVRPTNNNQSDFNAQSRDLDDEFGVDEEFNNTGVEAGGVLRKAFQSLKSKFTSSPVEEQLTNAGDVTGKTISDLGSKVGVDFGDLSKDDIGQVLSGLSKGAIDTEKITSSLGVIGDASEYLGPLGIVAGLGASIAGIFESRKVDRDLISKANDINSMTANINSLGGMSFGSISNSAIDTSQFRSGGAALNF